MIPLHKLTLFIPAQQVSGVSSNYLPTYHTDLFFRISFGKYPVSDIQHYFFLFLMNYSDFCNFGWSRRVEIEYNFFEIFEHFPNGILNFRSVWPSRPPRCSLFICLVFGIRCVWHAALKVVCFDFYPTPITSGIKGSLISKSFSALAQISKK